MHKMTGEGGERCTVKERGNRSEGTKIESPPAVELRPETQKISPVLLTVQTIATKVNVIEFGD